MTRTRKRQSPTPCLKLITTPTEVVPEYAIWEEHCFSRLVRWDEELWDFCEEFEAKHGFEPNTMLVEPGYLRLLNVALNNHPELWEGATNWVDFDRLTGACEIRFTPYHGVPPGIILLGWSEPEPNWE